MMTELNLKYSHSLSRDTGSFKLLQLSPELLKVLKSPDEQRKSSRFVNCNFTGMSPRELCGFAPVDILIIWIDEVGLSKDNLTMMPFCARKIRRTAFVLLYSRTLSWSLLHPRPTKKNQERVKVLRKRR